MAQRVIKVVEVKESIYQLMAEDLFGKRTARKHISDLLDEKEIYVPVCRKETHVWWGRNRTRHDVSGVWHIFTDYSPIWHVEMRNPYAWDVRPTYEDFMWAGLALLTMPDIHKVEDIAIAGCISI